MLGSLGAIFPITMQVMLKDQGAKQQIAAYSKGVTQAGKATRMFQGDLKHLAGAFTGLMVAGKIKGVFQAMLRPAMELEKALGRLQVVSSASGADMEAFTKKAYAVAKATPYSVTEVSNALLTLRKATGSTDKALGSLAAATNIAMGSFGKLDLDKSAELVADLARSFGMTGKEASLGADKIFYAVKKTGVSVEDFSGIIGRLGIAGLRGQQSFDDILTMFTMTKQLGFAKSRASQQLIRMLGEIQKGKRASALEGVGIFAKTATGDMKSFRDIIADISRINESEWGREMRDTLNQAFGERSVKPLLAMLRSLKTGIEVTNKDGTRSTLRHMAAWDYFQKGLKNASGTGEELAAKVREMADTQFKLLAQSVEHVGITFSQHFSPVLIAASKALKAVFEGLNALLNTPVLGWLMKTATGVLALSAAWWGIRAAYQGAARIFSVVNSNIFAGVAANAAHAKSAAASTAATNAQATAMGRLAIAGQAASASLLGTSVIPLGGAVTGSRTLANFGEAMGGIGAAAAFRQKQMHQSMLRRIAPASGRGLFGGGAIPFTRPGMMERVRSGLGKVGSGISQMGAMAKNAVPKLLTFLEKWGLVIAGIGYAIHKLGQYIKELHKEKIKKLGGVDSKKFKQAQARYEMMRGATPLGALVSWLGGGKDPYKAAIEAARKQAEISKQRDDYTRETARKLNDALVLGSARMGKMLGRWEDLIKFKPPVVKWKYLDQLESKLKAMQKRSSPENRSAIGATLKAIHGIRDIDKEAQSGILTPERAMEQRDKAIIALSMARHFQLMTGSMGKKFTENFAKEFVKPMHKALSDPAAIAHTQIVAAMHQGKLPLPKAIADLTKHGFDTRRGGFGARDTLSGAAGWGILRDRPTPASETADALSGIGGVLGRTFGGAARGIGAAVGVSKAQEELLSKQEKMHERAILNAHRKTKNQPQKVIIVQNIEHSEYDQLDTSWIGRMLWGG